MVSVAEPAGNGTTMRMGFAGYCARTSEDHTASRTAKTERLTLPPHSFLWIPRILSAARKNCSPTRAQARSWKPQATHRTLLARKHQKPITRLCGNRDATRYAA